MPYALRIGTGASMDRLERLIEQRLKPEADRELIDQRIWNLFGSRWAVMFTDLSGFSRQVAEFGIIHFLQVIYESQRMLVPCIEEHDGIHWPMELTMRNLQLDTFTTLYVSNLEPNAELRDREFEVRRLESH